MWVSIGSMVKILILVMGDSALAPRAKTALKYLGVKSHRVSNLLSNGSKKWGKQICT